jgi:hypothetical protein
MVTKHATDPYLETYESRSQSQAIFKCYVLLTCISNRPLTYYMLRLLEISTYS